MALMSPFGGRTRTRERGRLRLRSLLGHRKTLWLFLAIWLLGVTALAVVIRFQGNVDTKRQAQRATDTIQRQVGDLISVAFSPALVAAGAGPTAAETKHTPDGGQGHDSLIACDTEPPRGER